MKFESLNTNNADNTKSLMFLDDSGTTSIARYDKVKYKVFDRLTEEHLSFFWRPEEINLLKDQKDYRDLQPNEQNIISLLLSRQIILDSEQGRAPAISFAPLISIPELETWVMTWTFMETIHSKSYTHILRNVFSDPSIVFDKMMEIQNIVDCAKDISEHYDNLINYTQKYYFLGEGTHIVNGEEVIVSKYELKKLLWLCLNSVNVLEGIRFYASFAVSFAFGELKKMEGNAKIIRFIARDEAIHLGSTQTLIKLLPKDDSDFEKIRDECKESVLNIFQSAIIQEKQWADYLFKDGSIVGLNAKVLHDYVDFIAQSRMESIGIVPLKHKVNPLPWMHKWLNSKSVQVAPQETEISSYRTSDAKLDVADGSFKGFIL
jgi:ribonucleoside-diphosphate reductase beta chain